MTNQFFTVEENYKERFYQLPKVFFSNENYIELSNDAKIAYALLKDRLELSILNNWYDQEGKIYFIYTVDDLSQILNCGNKKITKIKKELENKNLLIQKRQGLNKPNLLYLLKPKITENDIYAINRTENSLNPSTDKEMSKRHVQKCQNDTSRNVKMTRQEVLKRHTNDTELSDTNYKETEINDTNDLNDKRENNLNNEIEVNNQPNHTNHLKQQSDEEALKVLELQEMPEQVKKYMYNFNAKEIQIIKSVILKAKRSFNDMYNEVYMLEDMDEVLLMVLKRFKGTVVKKQERIEAMQGYLMRCILSELEEMHSTNMRRKNFENSPLNVFNH